MQTTISIFLKQQSKRRVSLLALAACLLGQGCASTPSPASGGADASVDAPSGGIPTSLVVSVGQPVPRMTSWSVNYWRWMPDYGDHVSGTTDLIKALKPAFLRVGGYNNDVNLANPFDHAAFDRAVGYARAIGAEPIIQVPLLADIDGRAPTADTAAAMVSYANVTMGYGVKYFSIGNEPDLYATQGHPLNGMLPALPDYTPSAYCTSVLSYVAAMKAVDPTIRIVGPDLSWKYQPGGGENDWHTPILTLCGSAFDIIALHRYPFAAANAKLEFAATDWKAYRNIMGRVRGALEATGNGDKPLALTEMNIAYDKTWCTLDASPGTVGAALWLADSLGSSMELGLWTSAIWAIGDTDDWAQGLLGPAPGFVPRPAYYAYALYADHFGPTLVEVRSAPAGVSAYASRNATSDTTQVIVVNWNSSTTRIPVEVTGLSAVAPPTATFIMPAASMAALEIADNGLASAWVYGEAERQAGVGPQPLPTGPAVPYDASASADGGAGKAVGSGCGVSPDAASLVAGEAGSSTSCNMVAPETTGRLSVSGSYVTANGSHGHGGAWAWKGATSQATICAIPQCTTSDSLGFVAIDAVGGAPLSTEPISCTPSLPASALCIAGTMTRDPTYCSIVGVGMNLNQDPQSGSVQGIPITESIAVTTQLLGNGNGNSALRLQLVDMDGNFYCVAAGAWQSGIPTPITSFRKQCWDNSVLDAAAPVGTKARHFDVFLPGALSDQDFSFCMVDLAVK